MTQFTREEAIVAAAALTPVIQALKNLLDNPMLQLPEGIVDWEKAKELLLLHCSALRALNNIIVTGQ
jgi:hypothetical protein